MTTRESLGVFGLTVAGCTVGFLAGVLTAPRSGRDTRKRIGRYLDDERDALVRRGRDVASNLGERVEQGLESGKRIIAQATGR